MCTVIIFLNEAQATLLRRRKQVTMFGEVTQSTAGREGLQEKGSRSETGLSMVQIDLQENSYSISPPLV